jgi:hypothetical protein
MEPLDENKTTRFLTKNRNLELFILNKEKKIDKLCFQNIKSIKNGESEFHYQSRVELHFIDYSSERVVK